MPFDRSTVIPFEKFSDFVHGENVNEKESKKNNNKKRERERERKEKRQFASFWQYKAGVLLSHYHFSHKF